MRLWLCGICFKTHTLRTKCRHGNGSDFVSPPDGGDGVVRVVLYDLAKPQVPPCSKQSDHVNDGVPDLHGGFTLALLDSLFSKGCVIECVFCVVSAWKGKREGRTKLDDLSEEDYTSMSRVKHLEMIPTRRIARMKDDGDNVVFIILYSRKLGLNSRCEASLAKLAKDVAKPNLTHLRYVMICMVQSDEGRAIGKRLKLESKDFKSCVYAKFLIFGRIKSRKRGISLCILKTFHPRSNLECKFAIKCQRQKESIINAIRSWGMPGGSLQLLRKTLCHTSKSGHSGN
nr:splicing factor U2af large subunit B [Tanacetum cinerariifolium]